MPSCHDNRVGEPDLTLISILIRPHRPAPGAQLWGDSVISSGEIPLIRDTSAQHGRTRARGAKGSSMSFVVPLPSSAGHLFPAGGCLTESWQRGKRSGSTRVVNPCM